MRSTVDSLCIFTCELIFTITKSIRLVCITLILNQYVVLLDIFIADKISDIESMFCDCFSMKYEAQFGFVFSKQYKIIPKLSLYVKKIAISFNKTQNNAGSFPRDLIYVIYPFRGIQSCNSSVVARTTCVYSCW